MGGRGIGGGLGCGNVPVKNNANHILFQNAKYNSIPFHGFGVAIHAIRRKKCNCVDEGDAS